MNILRASSARWTTGLSNLLSVGEIGRKLPAVSLVTPLQVFFSLVVEHLVT